MASPLHFPHPLWHLLSPSATALGVLALSFAAAASAACSRDSPPAPSEQATPATPVTPGVSAFAPSPPIAPAAADVAALAMEPSAAASGGGASDVERARPGPPARTHVQVGAGDAGATAASADAGAAATGAECGRKPLPDCPLQGWMKNNTTPAITSKDFNALAVALDKIAAFAPGSGYPNWVSISKDGAAAARASELEAVKAACRGCHDQYKAKYKAELRGRPLPSRP
jgi:hypothetical protein